MERFRLLKAEEIDCRVGTVKRDDTGFSLLLYKDARVDMNILDETVGPLNWQKFYSRDNANCTVQIWDADKKIWVSKEDVGTESNTEAEKGLASDSFKRACFNWGIGRELYTAPFIWINQKCDKYEKFIVSSIDYDENRNINKLVIRSCKTNKVVFEMGKIQVEEKKYETITPEQKAQILKELNRTKVKAEDVLVRYKIKTLDDLSKSYFEGLIKNLLSLESR